MIRLKISLVLFLIITFTTLGCTSDEEKKAAHFSGGLNVHKYLKILTYQEPANNEISTLISEYSSRLSRIEGMEGHARACDWRLTKYNPGKEWDFNVYQHPKY